MLKQLAYKGINFLVFTYFKINCRQLKKKIYVFDIDNTLADTWISFQFYDDKLEHEKRLGSLAIFLNMRKLLIEKSLEPNVSVILLSARHFLDYKVTYKWLKSNNIDVKFTSLFIVPSAASKIKYLKYLLSLKKDLTYIDDLSYNHEKGNIKFYDKMIDEINKMPLLYINYNQILQINTGKNKL